MREKMIFVTSLFFNRIGNQSLLETVKEYSKKYDIIIISSASIADDYFLSNREALELLNFKIKIFRVYQTIPNFLRKLLKIIKTFKTKNSNSNVKNSNLINMKYKKINLLSLKVSNIFLYNKLKKVVKKNNVKIICAYEIGSFLAVSKFMKKNPAFVYLAKFQGTILGFDYMKLDQPEIKARYCLDIEMFKKAKLFDLCGMTNDGTNGDKVLEYFGVHPRKIFFAPNGISESISKIKKNIVVHTTLPEKINLFILSRLIGWKRVYLAIEIINYIVNFLKSLKFSLYIYGHGTKDEISVLKNLVKLYNLEKYVFIKGSINHSNLVEVFNNNHILLSLYKHTNVTNPVLEAFYLNKPVITLYDPSLNLIILKNKVNRVFVFKEIFEEQIIRDIATFLTSSNIDISSLNSFDLSWDKRITREEKILIKNYQNRIGAIQN